ncbi:MAG: bifunctional precorrin-2 dehydrogenase/sirohydrochlorin ferrochelatase, partial [Candidatus Dadabacteria bacterium]
MALGYIKAMGYIPLCFNLSGKKVLIVGGGKIAFDKLQKLLDFTSDITVIAPKISSELASLAEESGVECVIKEYESGDIDGFDLVIVCVDDLSLQRQIHQECLSARVLCCVVDMPELCDVIFPSYAKRGELVVSVSTSGASPALAKYLRRELEKHIPDNVEEFLTKAK